jgi:transposase-like protein
VSIDLTNPIFNDETAAWKHFENVRWLDGPVCPHCGVINSADPIIGKTARHGLYRCRECIKQFTATIGTIYEGSHIPMHKWLLAAHLMCASKKGMSAHQLWRMLGFGSYRTAWFMCHRIREAMTPKNVGPIGGRSRAMKRCSAAKPKIAPLPRRNRRNTPFQHWSIATAIATRSTSPT